MKVLAAHLKNIPPLGAKGKVVNVVVETPRGSRNKYKFDLELNIFRLGGLLSAGHTFPYDFGFIPNTIAEDGDPVDALVLMDEPGEMGLLVECRLIGGLKAFQTDRHVKTIRNDRMIAVAKDSVAYNKLRSIGDMGDQLVAQIEHFFVSYNEAKGRKLVVEERMEAADAFKVVGAAVIS